MRASSAFACASAGSTNASAATLRLPSLRTAVPAKLASAWGVNFSRSPRPTSATRRYGASFGVHHRQFVGLPAISPDCEHVGERAAERGVDLLRDAVETFVG